MPNYFPAQANCVAEISWKRTANISAFMSPTSARRLKVILQVQVSLRPSRESVTASSPMKRSKSAGSEWLA